MVNPPTPGKFPVKLLKCMQFGSEQYRALIQWVGVPTALYGSSIVVVAVVVVVVVVFGGAEL